MTEITDISQNKLEDYLSSTDFYIKLQQSDQELINCLFDNFQKIINYTFNDQKADSLISIKCLSFLLTRNIKIHNRLLQETNIIDFLTNYPLKFDAINHILRTRYAEVLEAFLLPEPYQFNKNVGNNQLFENLISVCDYNSSFETIKKVISEEDQKVIYHLLTIHFIDNVSRYITGIRIINFNSQQILIHLIDRGCENFVAESLTKNALFSSYVYLAFNNQTVSKNFYFIEKIYRYSVKYSKNSNWNTLEIIISSRIDDFRKIVMNTDKWCDTSNISVSIINHILLFHNRFSDKDYDMFHFLIDKFFSMPNCSILHLSVLKYFMIMQELGKLNLKILKDTFLIKRIIECYKKREQSDDPQFVYFGAIREMSNFITPYIDKENYDDWNTIVLKRNKEINNIIDKNNPLQCRKRSIFSFPNKTTSIVLLSVISIIIVLLVSILINI